MTAEERKLVVARLTAGTVQWREIEALGAIDLPEARAALEAAANDHASINNRLAAAEQLDRLGLLKASLDDVLAQEIRNLHEVGPALVRALLLAETHHSDAVKQSLLWASYNRTEAAMHCAALLCYVCGVAKEAFDWDLRPLFLRLAPDNSHFERKKAFDELCALVKMNLTS